jgi:hypothetical protein
MLYGLSNILKRETREGREESKTADREGAASDLSDEMAQTGRDSSLVRIHGLINDAIGQANKDLADRLRQLEAIVKSYFLNSTAVSGELIRWQ